MQLEPHYRGLGAQAVGLNDSQGVDGQPERRLINVTVLVGDVDDAGPPLLTVSPGMRRSCCDVLQTTFSQQPKCHGSTHSNRLSPEGGVELARQERLH